MGVPTNFPESPYEISDPESRWTPDQDYLRRGETNPLPPLVRKARKAVKEWRDNGYKGATDTSRALLRWWFAEEKYNEGMDAPFNYYFAQREAVETVIWLVDVFGFKNKVDLLKLDETGELAEKDFYEHWRRLVIKMATGSGKTKVMSLLLAWSFFHKEYEKNSSLARNFLVIAPNIIVLERLKADFKEGSAMLGESIFYKDKVIPSNGFKEKRWKDDFQLTVHHQDNVSTVNPKGNLFLTNIHRIYAEKEKEPTLKQRLMGMAPSKNTNKNASDLGKIVHRMDELMVINDEAHHIHKEELVWFQSIKDIHGNLKQKDKQLALQLDFTATPKYSDGRQFTQIVADYPLVEAIHQDIVKSPVIPNEKSLQKLKMKDNKIQFAEKYSDYINLGIAEWKRASKYHQKQGEKAVLFIMTDNTKNCDDVANYLRRHKEFSKEDSVLVIHTKDDSQFSDSKRDKEELKELRELANKIDDPDSPYKAVVSVMMLKEGWDVRNVTTIVGLRPFKAKNKILPEQALGRGLRLIYPMGFKIKEQVSVIGVKEFMEFIKGIEEEGVILKTVAMGPDGNPIETVPQVVRIKENYAEELDIKIPIIKSMFFKGEHKLSDLDPADFEFEKIPLKQIKPSEDKEIKFIFVGDKKISHTTTFKEDEGIDPNTLIRWITDVIRKEVGLLQTHHGDIYGITKQFITNHLFGTKVDLTDENVLRNLAQRDVLDLVIQIIREEVRDTISSKESPIKDYEMLAVSSMEPYTSNLPACSELQKSVQQTMPYGLGLNLEYKFARFLDECEDIISFAKIYQRLGFYVNYTDKDGKQRKYYPDFVVKTAENQIYIIETKGREGDHEEKIAGLKQWCQDVNSLATDISADFVFVDQKSFEADPPKNFTALTKTFTRYH